ncbi:hypothetical protein KIN20_015914 [Parelaphostrongylus tenuis]|uniref:Amino acid transporter n=1 Tax=Parelaphostrongylus tenuis TaxID=148309 RepID=A0AAD5QPD4_PARTN|nr:hypothetical protein KIN20_015914 [Parelaphostrongylus tenuis]
MRSSPVLLKRKSVNAKKLSGCITSSIPKWYTASLQLRGVFDCRTMKYSEAFNPHPPNKAIQADKEINDFSWKASLAVAGLAVVFVAMSQEDDQSDNLSWRAVDEDVEDDHPPSDYEFTYRRSCVQLGAKESGKVGTLAITYYLVTTVLAVITGLVLVLSIHPGDPKLKNHFGEGTVKKKVNTIDAMFDLMRNAFPDNIVVAAFKQAGTKYATFRPKIMKTNTSSYRELFNNGTFDYVKATVQYIDGINALG